MGPLYHKFNILKLSDLYRLELGKFMHMFFCKSIPCYFDNYFLEFKNANKHDTRSCTSRNLKLPLHSINRTQKSIKFQGAKLWNVLSFSLKQQSRRNLLKNSKVMQLRIICLSSLLLVQCFHRLSKITKYYFLCLMCVYYILVLSL